MVYKYSYLIGAIAFLIIWFSIYLYKKQFRKEMLLMSLLTTPLGPISEIFYFKDYWNPELLINIFGFGIEDIIFAFAIGGIASVIYEKIFVKKNLKTKPIKKSFFLITIVFAVLVFLILNQFLNSMHATPIVFLLTGILILTQRKDLIKNAIISGVLISLIMFIGYLILLFIFPDFITSYWQIENISNIFILKIPIEELIWGFSWGFLAGPFYEFWKGKKHGK